MKQVLDTKGQVSVEDVPPPGVEPGRLLVRTAFSCISPGTELSGLKASATPLWRKAVQKPQHVRKVLEIAQQRGLRSAMEAVQSKTATAKPLGYSLSGTVVGVGEGIHEFRIGDLVACAGAQAAFHAEYVSIPQNLAVRVPEGVSLEEASTVALGAIALQGVRRAEPTLGETFLVIGLGLLGQLTVQLLRASGCHVLGSDLNPARIALAKEFGLRGECGPGHVSGDALLSTGAAGVDGVIITASGQNDEILHQAFLACRKKARVVLVGDVPLNIRREDIYEKELDFRVSTSYGPGRYDRRFEEEGLDYPLPYVRWTECRNMQAYLDAIAAQRVRLSPILGAPTPVDQAPAAFSALRDGKALAGLLDYRAAGAQIIQPHVPSPRPARTESVRLAVIGAGSFVENVHLPNLKALSARYELGWIVNRSGHKAKSLAARTGAAQASADWRAPLADPAVNAVLIGTRHDQHAMMALTALESGKHVLLEKPLAITHDEVAAFRSFFADRKQSPLLMTGYNRRFSPAATRAAQLLQGRKGPVIVQCTVNAGFLPSDHWTQGPEGGGRNLGEACHFYDLFLHFTGADRWSSLNVSGLGPSSSPFQFGDNFQATFNFPDGSMCSLLYTSMGNAGHPKEEIRIFWDGKVFQIDDFKTSRFVPSPGVAEELRHDSKGHREELERFSEGLRTGTWPISLQEQLTSAEMALRVQKQLQRGAQTVNS